VIRDRFRKVNSTPHPSSSLRDLQFPDTFHESQSIGRKQRSHRSRIHIFPPTNIEDWGCSVLNPSLGRGRDEIKILELSTNKEREGRKGGK
jgi:hypothetical protein